MTFKGRDAIRAGLEQKLAEGKGLVRAELASLKGAPVILMWQYAKGGAKTRLCLQRVSRFKNGLIHRAYVESRPERVNEAQPSGLDAL